MRKIIAFLATENKVDFNMTRNLWKIISFILCSEITCAIIIHYNNSNFNNNNSKRGGIDFAIPLLNTLFRNTYAIDKCDN